jgi:hypothetical protein
MNISPGSMDIRKNILDILAALPKNRENRCTIVRLLWGIAAGPIITGHVDIIHCTPDGRLVIQIDDYRWVREIKRVSDIILHRINRMLSDLKCSEYAIRDLTIHSVAPKKPEIAPEEKAVPVTIPQDIMESASILKDDLKEAFLEWYKTVKAQHQPGNCIS